MLLLEEVSDLQLIEILRRHEADLLCWEAGVRLCDELLGDRRQSIALPSCFQEYKLIRAELVRRGVLKN